jgi:hypothetical protein
MGQPVPEVTKADVTRVIRREFPNHNEDEIKALLARYGRRRWEAEPERVHLAILKLSDGDFEKLRMNLEIACDDYRDVLAMAEYPLSMKHGFGPYKKGERKMIYDADWKQYVEWLNRE